MPQTMVMRLIVINVVLFVIVALFKSFWLLSGNNFAFPMQQFLGLPATVAQLLTKPWTLVTYAFMHAGLLHLLFNMLSMFWLGQLLEEYIGRKHILPIYLFGALVGALVFLGAFNVFPLFKAVKSTTFLIGASAGVLAIVVGAATLLPHYTIRLILFGNVALKWVATGIIILDLIGISGVNAGGHFAHLGGALAGFLYIKGLQNGFNIYNYSLFKRKSKTLLKVVAKNSSKKQTPKTNTVNEAIIDAILDKINKTGYESLSEIEKQQLFKASKN